jgi:prephenate dehydratase
MDVKPKVLGSYPQYDYQPPDNIQWQIDMDDIIDRLKNGAQNGVHEQDKTVVAFTLVDQIGALRDAIEPFAVRGIQLTEIASLPTGRLGEYAFYLSFVNGVNQRRQALEELERYCTRVKVLEKEVN